MSAQARAGARRTRSIFGDTELTNALMQGAGWVIYLAIAERAIRRPERRSAPARVQVAIS